MEEHENKERMQRIFDELSKGNGRPLVDAMSEDFCWVIAGTSGWSGTYRGKETVVRQLLQPLFAQFADRYTNTATRILADQDYVVVECQGSVTTTSGKRYDNSYCWVVRMADGQMKELIEYADTGLMDSALQAPGTAGGPQR